MLIDSDIITNSEAIRLISLDKIKIFVILILLSVIYLLAVYLSDFISYAETKYCNVMNWNRFKSLQVQNNSQHL